MRVVPLASSPSFPGVTRNPDMRLRYLDAVERPERTRWGKLKGDLARVISWTSGAASSLASKQAVRSCVLMDEGWVERNSVAWSGDKFIPLCIGGL
jgi:hypothetical protein